jgi:hypothetical protein
MPAPILVERFAADGKQIDSRPFTDTAEFSAYVNGFRQEQTSDTLQIHVPGSRTSEVGLSGKGVEGGWPSN